MDKTNKVTPKTKPLPRLHAYQPDPEGFPLETAVVSAPNSTTTSANSSPVKAVFNK
jgi:hypothetical protein